MQEILVKVGQTQLQIRDYEGQGDAVVFLHFSSANLMMWQRVIPHFRVHYRLVLVDLRGHGKSAKPDTGYHMDVMACDVDGILQYLEIERAHIVGSSLGAEVGLSLAANYPEKVISLVCDGALSSEYGPYGTWEGSEAEFQEHAASHLEKMRNAPEKIFPTLEALVDNSREALEKYGYWNEYVEAVERYGAYRMGEGQYTKSFRKPARIDYMTNYFQYRLEDYYAKLKCPVLMLPGEDLLQNERERAAMEGLSKLARRAQVIQVKGWDHPYGWLMDPNAVCEKIFEFLKDTPD